MIKLQTYAGISLVAMLGAIYHAFSGGTQFYLATVYLATSKISLVILMNMGLVVMCFLWHLAKRVFLGTLREAEVERLNEQFWKEIFEIVFAVTIFRRDLTMVTSVPMIAALLAIKSLHWLVQKRVEYIETTPTVTRVSHFRTTSFMGFLFVMDSLFVYNSLKFIVHTRQASVALFFCFEYTILALTIVSTFVKYVFYIGDMIMEGRWERKAVYTFYLELIHDLLHLSLYLCFFAMILLSYGVPLHLLRELYQTFRSFKVRIADYLRYRKITSNMNERFPDVTPEELNSNDATCIICREEMTTAKKLNCGHMFHVYCLRTWLERNNSCPICRAPVTPPDSAMNTNRGPYARSGANQQGTTHEAQGSSSNSVANDISPEQARLQAAAAAASIYEKSYVYPSASKLVMSPGYAFQVPGASASHGETFGDDAKSQLSQSEIQKIIIQTQIEVLRKQLHIIQKQAHSERVNAPVASTSSDDKGKMHASSSTLAPNQHGSEDTDHM